MNKAKEKTGTRKRQAMPKGYAGVIAQALGLSRSTVYAVAQGRHTHKEVARLIALAKDDRTAFANAIAEARVATTLLNA
jgi:predicted transcriptional regulator